MCGEVRAGDVGLRGLLVEEWLNLEEPPWGNDLEILVCTMCQGGI